MRLPQHLLRHPTGMWHFRLTVPRDLWAVVGVRVLKRSLHTRAPVAARHWAYTLGAHYAQLFTTARPLGKPDTPLEEAGERCEKAQGLRWE